MNEVEYRVLVSDGRLFARYTNPQEKVALAGIPGGKHIGRWACYSFPDLPRVAVALCALYDRDAVSPDAQALAHQQTAIVATARAIRRADGLPGPRSKTASWQHQKQAFHFLKDLPAAAIFMEMGCGKSKVAVDIICYRRHKLVLIVCPVAVLDVWPDQFATHAAEDFEIFKLVGSAHAKLQRLAAARELAEEGTPTLVLVSYESAWRLAALVTTPWDCVVLDESHKIKSAGSRVSLFFAKLGSRVAHRMLLTGTPMADKPLDIYGQYRFLEPTIFGTSYNRFRQRYAEMGGYMQHEIRKYINQDELAEKVYEIGFRVKSSDVLDLPPVQHITRYCELGPEALKLYKELDKEMVAEFADNTFTTEIVLSKILRLQQLTGGSITNDDREVVKIDGSKDALFAETLAEIPAKSPVVVFARFKADIDAILSVARAAGITCSELSGSKNDLALWQRGGCDLLAVQIQSGGAGVDLTRSRYCVYYSVGHSLEQYEQSLARVHRPGQASPVLYIHLLAKRTIDELVYKALAKKKNVVDVILEGRKR